MATEEQFVILNDDTAFYNDAGLPFKSIKAAEEHVIKLFERDKLSFANDIMIVKIVRKLGLEFSDV